MNTKVSMEFVFRFQRKITGAKANIIEYLINHDGKFYGSYRNLCRHVHELAEMGIITSIVDEQVTSKSKTLIGLNDDWTDHI